MIKFDSIRSFDVASKRLAKKYKSLEDDLEKLMNELQNNPLQGSDLGRYCRKVRMAITSKNKGKSGGARVITNIEAITTEKDGVLTFLYIYDKSEKSNITDAELTALLEELNE